MNPCSVPVRTLIEDIAGDGDEGVQKAQDSAISLEHTEAACDCFCGMVMAEITPTNATAACDRHMHFEAIVTAIMAREQVELTSRTELVSDPCKVA